MLLSDSSELYDKVCVSLLFEYSKEFLNRQEIEDEVDVIRQNIKNKEIMMEKEKEQIIENARKKKEEELFRLIE